MNFHKEETVAIVNIIIHFENQSLQQNKPNQ